MTLTSKGKAPADSANNPPPQQPRRSHSPTGSFYAMSDDEEGEYNTITHTETGKGVKLLYSKSKVRFKMAIALPR